MNLTFKTLARVSAAREKERDPDNKCSGLLYRAVELAGECGELCNVVKKLERARLGVVGSTATQEQLKAELADVAIALDLVATAAGVDLAEAVRAKFNLTSQQLGLKTKIE
jgi:NTP pyrophosphatase (non-canonical NTP hydrolase)